MADAAAVRALCDERTRAILFAFAAPRSIAVVAGALGQPVGKIFYHVRKLERLGLLVLDRSEPRRGKPIRYYRAVARAFLLPAELIERPFTDNLAHELRSSLEHNFYRADLAGMVVWADEDGEVQVEMRARDGARRSPAAAEMWHVLRLPRGTAAALGAELRALFEKYEAASGSGPEYLIHAAFAIRAR